MSPLEKIVYFLVAVALYLATLGTAFFATTPTPELEQVAIGISLVEAAHWYYGLKHRRIGAYFWGTLVVIATLVLLLKKTIGVQFWL
ncbi:hypothetical protein GYA27_03105 [candidate division WWE3 bacterium]|uniref:Uncharacterized protein n=1 Tax=candidate division WWE3 bacterium TaxID=2053526 RepID=A0A7X9HH25_UNCKA|nr:hypothetical protein [candidate division WWE3 bacterium]